MPRMSTAKALAEEPTLTVDEAAELLGMSRSGTYNAIRDGNIPNIKIGRLIRVPSAPLRKLLGIEEPHNT